MRHGLGSSLALGSLLLVLACNRQRSEAPSPAPSASVTEAAPPASAAASAIEATRPGDPFDEVALAPSQLTEAQRATLAHAGYRELLGPVLDRIEARFPGVASEAISLQVVALPNARRAVLVSHEGPGNKPMLFVFDIDRQLVWMRERSLAGVDAHLSTPTLCPGPSGEVLQFWYDVPTRTVAARRLDDSGSLLADFQLQHIEHVDALSALQIPGTGWLVVATGNAQLRAQLLTESGKLPWGSEGRLVAETGVAVDAAALVRDTPLSAVLVWSTRTAQEAPASSAQFKATRLDIEGHTLLSRPVSLGPAPQHLNGARPTLERIDSGLIRATLPRPSRADRYMVLLTAEGQVLLR